MVGETRVAWRANALLIAVLAVLGWLLVTSTSARADESPTAAAATTAPAVVASDTVTPRLELTPAPAPAVADATVGRRAEAVAPTPSRTVSLPTTTIVVTDSNGSTVAAVGGVETTRGAITTPAAGGNSTPPDPVARTGSRVQTQLLIAVVLTLVGSALVVLGLVPRRREH